MKPAAKGYGQTLNEFEHCCLQALPRSEVAQIVHRLNSSSSLHYDKRAKFPFPLSSSSQFHFKLVSLFRVEFGPSRVRAPVRYLSMSAETLIQACAESNDAAAWKEFVSRFHRAISLSILRAASHWSEAPLQVVDDLAQETYLKLCANRCRLLCDFSLEHPESITGYIKTIAVNVTHDHFKALHSQ